MTQSAAPRTQTDQARLAVVNSTARVSRSGGIEFGVEQAQATNIQVGDKIEVAAREGQNKQSYSILHFPDFLNVELFGNSKVFLSEVKRGAVDSIEATLDLDGGNMFVHLNDQSTSRVMVQTLYATIESLTAGAEFDVCYNEEFTCVLVKKGIVEIMAQNRKELVRAGEAIQILKDQPPSPAICAPLPAFLVWEERFREFAGTPALDQEISALPQKVCPQTTLGLPLNARILYRNEFSRPSSGWVQGKIDEFNARYVRDGGRRYYEVQAQAPNHRYLAFVPNGRSYGDVNIDIRVRVAAGGGGDFRYGIVFRRSGDRYYAFAISPISKSWYFFKNSSEGVEVLEKGIDERMRGLEGRDILRVESYGSTLLVFINGRFIYSIINSEYISGEAGLFVETFDNADAIVRFDSIILWDMPPEPLIPVTGGGENCFNTIDDDGDGWVDRADLDCQRREISLILTSLPLPTSTLGTTNTPQPTNTLRPTSTPGPTRTPTLRPTVTRRPTLTATARPTSTRRPTLTATPRPTSTRRPTLTPTRRPSLTPLPQPTSTRRPTLTPTQRPTLTPVPQPTDTPRPTSTDPPPSTNTPQPEPTATDPPEPTATDPPEPTATDPPEPTATDPPEPTATDPPVALSIGQVAGRRVRAHPTHQSSPSARNAPPAEKEELRVGWRIQSAVAKYHRVRVVVETAQRDASSH